MKILFLAKHKWPRVGGVERHTERVANSLQRLGHQVTIISEEDIKYPHIKFAGLMYIWFWIYKNRSLIDQSDIIHCHDVFIWYLPFKFLYPKKAVYTTFHGWEGIWPIPWKNIMLKKLANRLSTGSIAIGRYIEKYYGIKADKIIYGGINKKVKIKNKNAKSWMRRQAKFNITYVGRLEGDTGLPEFLNWLQERQKYRVDFVGDGNLRKECEKFGTVHGFTAPVPFLEHADICVPSGYLSYLEAKSYGCEIMTFYSNPLKEDYWNEIKRLKTFPTWDKVADIYLKLWHA